MPYKRLLVNKNKMLFECEGATGVKTGYTKKLAGVSYLPASAAVWSSYRSY